MPGVREPAKREQTLVGAKNAIGGNGDKRWDQREAHSLP